MQPDNQKQCSGAASSCLAIGEHQEEHSFTLGHSHHHNCIYFILNEFQLLPLTAKNKSSATFILSVVLSH